MTDGFKCLAIETATQNCSIAACNGRQVSLRESAIAGEQSRYLFDWVAEVLEEQSLSLGALDCLALGVGPGGFTGLRVGAAAAQGLALGSGRRVCRVSTLAALAMGAARASGNPLVAACLDARMGEAYLGRYRILGDGLVDAEMADRLIDPGTFVFSDSAAFHAAGPGWAEFPQLHERQGERIISADTARLPSAIDTLLLAETVFQRGEAVAPAEALPNYVRETVTQTGR